MGRLQDNSSSSFFDPQEKQKSKTGQAAVAAVAGGTSPERMAAEGEPEAPPYGSVPVAPSLAWTDVKLDEVKDFMKIHEVSACLPPRCFQHSPARDPQCALPV